MEEVLSLLERRPGFIITDVGYCSEDNFFSLSELDYPSLIKYDNYEREEKKRYYENAFMTEKW